MKEGEKLLTSEQLADELHVSRRAIQHWSQRGIIKAAVTLPGGIRRYYLSEVLAQLREREQQGDDAP